VGESTGRNASPLNYTAWNPREESRARGSIFAGDRATARQIIVCRQRNLLKVANSRDRIGRRAAKGYNRHVRTHVWRVAAVAVHVNVAGVGWGGESACTGLGERERERERGGGRGIIDERDSGRNEDGARPCANMLYARARSLVTARQNRRIVRQRGFCLFYGVPRASTSRDGRAGE